MEVSLLQTSGRGLFHNEACPLLLKVRFPWLLFQNGRTSRHVNATKSYLHFDRFAGEVILCSNFFCFSLFLDVLFLS